MTFNDGEDYPTVIKDAVIKFTVAKRLLKPLFQPFPAKPKPI